MYGNPWIGQCFLCFSYIAIFLTTSTLNNKQLHTESENIFQIHACMSVSEVISGFEQKKELHILSKVDYILLNDSIFFKSIFNAVH